MSKEMIVKLNSDRVKIKGCEYVQDLVRCKECRHDAIVDRFDDVMCRKTGARMKKNDFCSYGEREESDD